MFTSSVRARPCPADRPYLASAMHWQRQPDSLDVIGGGNAASGLPLGRRRWRSGQSVRQRDDSLQAPASLRCRAADPATPHRTWIQPGRVPPHRAGPGRTRARRWSRVRCAAGWRGRSPRPGTTSPGQGADLGEFHPRTADAGLAPRRAPRDSISAGKHANHPAAAGSGWSRKIQRTSRLRTPSVTGLPGGSADIVPWSGARMPTSHPQRTYARCW